MENGEDRRDSSPQHENQIVDPKNSSREAGLEKQALKQPSAEPNGWLHRLRRSPHSEYDYTWTGELWNVCLCPPTRLTATALTVMLMVGGLWCALFAVTDAGGVMLPGGPGFALFILVILCLVGGSIVELLRLPPLLGMLTVGILLRNIPGCTIGSDLNPTWSSKLRTGALMVILTRAGLGLDPEALKRLSLVVLRLAFVPCLVEATVVGIAGKFFLGFPWSYSFMLGFILAAVSPAVVVPCLLKLQERRLGVDKGIPTLVIAAASIDDVLAISAFGLVFGITFSQGGIVMQVLGGPLQAIAGILWGLLLGCVLWFLPAEDSGSIVFSRCVLLSLAGLVALYGGPLIGFQGFGALGTLAAAFVAGYGWKKQTHFTEGQPVADFFGSLWFIFQPLLFGLIGAEIDVFTLKLETVGYGVATLACGLTCRFFATYFVVKGAGLSRKERLFVALAWLPKATVQAALAPLVLDYALQAGLSGEVIQWGTDILTISVLVILITAPIGAVAIMLSAPKLLQHSPVEENVQNLNKNPTQLELVDDIEMQSSR